MFFKNKDHETAYMELYNKFEKLGYYMSEALCTFIYLLTASGKAYIIDKYISEDEIDFERLRDDIQVFSSSEKSLIRFGLQCYHSTLDNITLPEVFGPLDPANEKIVHNVIKILYPVR